MLFWSYSQKRQSMLDEKTPARWPGSLHVVSGLGPAFAFGQRELSLSRLGNQNA